MPAVIQRSDFYAASSVLHPLVVGSIILLVVYVYVRLSSARALSGMTVFSVLVNLTLGSTMSRAITQPDLNLTRGLISIAVIFAFEYITDWISARHSVLAKLFEKEPEILVFRGEIQRKMLKTHRMGEGALWQSLRQHGCLDMKKVEAVVLEMNGLLSVIGPLDDPAESVPALERIPQYNKLREEWEAGLHRDKLQATKDGSDGHSAATVTA